MRCKAAVFDIDGTLVCEGRQGPDEQTLRAVRGLQQAGISVAVATGRCLAAAKQILGALQPDYYLTCNGAYCVSAQGEALFAQTLSAQDMYALVDFCENDEHPLAFAYPEGYYAYVEYERFFAHYAAGHTSPDFVYDNENQTRHLQGAPYGAVLYAPAAAQQAFCAQYAHLGLSVLPFGAHGADVFYTQTDKAHALTVLARRCGISCGEIAAFGDGLNDAAMLRKAGVGAAMRSGHTSLHRQADLVADNIACAVREIFGEVTV